VPYHQNVYDLLQLEPGESPEAARMIAEHEAAHGPLPAAVREWYLVPSVVPLVPSPESQAHPAALHGLFTDCEGTLWCDFSNLDHPTPLASVLREFALLSGGQTRPYVPVLLESQCAPRWWVEVNETSDPRVWSDNDNEHPDDWVVVADSFSQFLTDWFTRYYLLDWTPCSRNSSGAQSRGVPRSLKPYANGLWLRTPAEPFAPPVIDYLTDHLGEPERTPRPGEVTTYTFRPDGGTVRVTADHPSLTGGLSAWWLHAESPERLAELGRLLLPWGTLRETLRADTDPAREVLEQLRGASSS
jgi:hypothetical protein